MTPQRRRAHSILDVVRDPSRRHRKALSITRMTRDEGVALERDAKRPCVTAQCRSASSTAACGRVSTKEVVGSFWKAREAIVGGHMTQTSAARRTSSGASPLGNRAPGRGFGGSVRPTPTRGSGPSSEGLPDGSSKREARPLWISYPDAAELTTLSVRSLKRLTAEGKLPCFLIGGKVLRLRISDV